MRLLVCAADPGDRAEICAALAQAGFGPDVVEVGSAADATAALTAGSFTAVLVTGLALVAQIRPAGGGAAILLMTPTADAALVASAIAAGVTDVLVAGDREPQRLALRVRLAARAADQLARANVGRDDLLSIVSHDLRGPLHAIGLAVEALRDEIPAESQRFLGAIERSAERAERLIRELLEANMIDSGRLELSRASIDASAIVRQATADHARLATESGGTIAATLPAAGVVVYADRDRVMQVLANLIGNALKHARGSKIELTVEVEADAARISVRDRGPGISAADLPSVFDRYLRRHQPRKGGAGLGLGIAKGIVTAHGGELAVLSEVGAGAEFFFTLPLAKPRAS